ncbi:MAG: hypothetical protein ABSC16_02535 [Candidatus Dormibacteria bacterium]
MRHRIVALTLLAGTAILIAGCGAGSQPATSTSTPPPSSRSTSPSVVAAATPTPSPTPGGPTAGPGGCQVAASAGPPAGVTLITCYSMTGEVVSSGGFYDDLEGNGAVSCSDWARSGEQVSGAAGEVLPAPDPSTAGVAVNGQELAFTFYIGPYTGPGSYPSTDLDELASLGDTDWNNVNATDFTAHVSADGSGSLSASLTNEAGNGETETIIETWICVTEPSD